MTYSIIVVPVVVVTVLVTLAGLVQAPYAPWSSDRSVRFRVSATAWGRRRQR